MKFQGWEFDSRFQILGFEASRVLRKTSTDRIGWKSLKEPRLKSHAHFLIFWDSFVPIDLLVLLSMILHICVDGFRPLISGTPRAGKHSDHEGSPWPIAMSPSFSLLRFFLIYRLSYWFSRHLATLCCHHKTRSVVLWWPLLVASSRSERSIQLLKRLLLSWSSSPLPLPWLSVSQP